MSVRIILLLYLFISIPFSAYETGQAAQGKKIIRTTKFLIGNMIATILLFILVYIDW